jgi:hypothetical protein
MFGGGSGHIFDMISRMKANLAMRKKKSYFKTFKENPLLPGKTKVVFKRSSEDDMESIRVKISQNKRKELRHTIMIFLVGIIATIILILIVSTSLIYFWNINADKTRVF